jgi:hypothetical protein
MTSLITRMSLLIILFGLAWYSVYQSWVYQELQENFDRLNAQQEQIYQENKRLQAKLAELRSPKRASVLLAQHPEWQLEYLKPQNMLIIQIDEEKTE